MPTIEEQRDEFDKTFPLPVVDIDDVIAHIYEQWQAKS